MVELSFPQLRTWPLGVVPIDATPDRYIQNRREFHGISANEQNALMPDPPTFRFSSFGYSVVGGALAEFVTGFRASDAVHRLELAHGEIRDCGIVCDVVLPLRRYACHRGETIVPYYRNFGNPGQDARAQVDSEKIFCNCIWCPDALFSLLPSDVEDPPMDENSLSNECTDHAVST